MTRPTSAGSRRSARRWRTIARDGVVMATAISELGQDLTRPQTTADPHARRLAHRRPQGVLHDVAGRDGAAHRGDLRRRRRRRALRLRPGPRRTRPACGSTATGTRSACAPRAATPSRFDRRRGPGRRAARRLPGRRRRRLHGPQPRGRASSTRRRRSASPRARRAAAAGALGDAAASRMPARRTLVAENAIELGAVPRDAVAARATLVDEADEDDLVALFAETQAAKTFVNEAAGADRRPRARAVGRRRLPQRPPARARVPRRPRRQLHAPARRQPRLRPPRRRRARPRAASSTDAHP